MATIPEYTVVDLGPDRLEAAWVLVRSVDPLLTLEQWLEEAGRAASDGGILGLSNREGQLFGLLTFHAGPLPPHGTSLSIERLVVFELARAGAGRRMLLRALHGIADRLGCDAVSWTADRASGASPGLHRRPSGRAPASLGP